MTAPEILKQLEAFGNEGTKRVLLKHGAKEPFFGVKVQDLKKIQKKVKKNQVLALELYATGNSDAMYLAGLIADEDKMTKAQLQNWVEQAYWYYLSEYTVPWVASETPFGLELGLEWIDSNQENIAAAGWATLASIAGITPDTEIDFSLYTNLLDRVQQNIHQAKNRERYTMNGFIIAIGSYLTELTPKAQTVAAEIGKVSVEMGGTSCKVPLAKDYIQKIIDKGRVGKKRKSARC